MSENTEGSIKETTKYVIEFYGEFWGRQYSDGRFNNYDYGPIENAMLINKLGTYRPEDYARKGRHEVEPLKKGDFRAIKITYTYI